MVGFDLDLRKLDENGAVGGGVESRPTEIGRLLQSKFPGMGIGLHWLVHGKQGRQGPLLSSPFPFRNFHAELSLALPHAAKVHFGYCKATKEQFNRLRPDHPKGTSERPLTSLRRRYGDPALYSQSLGSLPRRVLLFP